MAIRLSPRPRNHIGEHRLLDGGEVRNTPPGSPILPPVQVLHPITRTSGMLIDSLPPARSARPILHHNSHSIDRDPSLPMPCETAVHGPVHSAQGSHADPKQPPLSRTVCPAHDSRFDIAWIESIADLHSELGEWLGDRTGLVVTTPTVNALYGEQIMDCLHAAGATASQLVLSLTESAKTLEQVERVCRESLARNLGRNSVLIALGGGVCSDVTTVAAQMIRRGIPLVRVPTTLLSQVDAGIGIKGAVHLDSKKNYLGCFYPPKRVLISPSFLTTLCHRQLRSGMAEIAKVAIAKDATLFRSLEEHGADLIESRISFASPAGRHLMASSIDGLLSDVEGNFYEDQSLVRSMDLGHTFSPALESASQFEILHGEAVAIDMAFSACIAMELNWIEETDAHRILRLLTGLGLALDSNHLSPSFCLQSIAETTRHRGGKLNLFLPTGIGTSRELTDGVMLPPRLLSRALSRLRLF